MEGIFKHFRNRHQHPPFAVYAYTSKSPFLLERREWKRLSQYGAEILLKNRISPQDERCEIDGDIHIRKRNARRVFIGHGRSPAWHALRSFLENDLSLKYEELNRVSAAGVNTQERLTEMLDNCGFAFLVLTAEDIGTKKRKLARQNVIHEAGLFQGRLGMRRAIILLENGCKEFSNILGLNQIRFSEGKIEKSFSDVRLVLAREGLI
jgi:predicted nucleotide-binding protein